VPACDIPCDLTQKYTGTIPAEPSSNIVFFTYDTSCVYQPVVDCGNYGTGDASNGQITVSVFNNTGTTRTVTITVTINGISKEYKFTQEGESGPSGDDYIFNLKIVNNTLKKLVTHAGDKFCLYTAANEDATSTQGHVAIEYFGLPSSGLTIYPRDSIEGSNEYTMTLNGKEAFECHNCKSGCEQGCADRGATALYFQREYPAAWFYVCIANDPAHQSGIVHIDPLSAENGTKNLKIEKGQTYTMYISQIDDYCQDCECT
jgi:hypothetical protein